MDLEAFIYWERQLATFLNEQSRLNCCLKALTYLDFDSVHFTLSFLNNRLREDGLDDLPLKLLLIFG